MSLKKNPISLRIDFHEINLFQGKSLPCDCHVMMTTLLCIRCSTRVLGLEVWSLLIWSLNLHIFFSCAKRLKACMVLYILRKLSALQSTWTLTTNTDHPDSDVKKRKLWKCIYLFPSSFLPLFYLTVFLFVLMHLNTNSRYEIISFLPCSVCISLEKSGHFLA